MEDCFFIKLTKRKMRNETEKQQKSEGTENCKLERSLVYNESGTPQLQQQVNLGVTTK